MKWNTQRELWDFCKGQECDDVKARLRKFVIRWKSQSGVTPETHELWLNTTESGEFCRLVYGHLFVPDLLQGTFKDIFSDGHTVETGVWAEHESFEEFMENERYKDVTFKRFAVNLFCDDVHGAEFRPKSPAIGVAASDSFTCPECKKTFCDVLIGGGGSPTIKKFHVVTKVDVAEEVKSCPAYDLFQKVRKENPQVFGYDISGGFGKPETMDFSQALLAMKAGKNVRRVKWDAGRVLFTNKHGYLMETNGFKVDTPVHIDSIGILSTDWQIVP
jgi:hypothetical protein